jgi:peptidoglycan/LPS O-acetylase OafA/YrhL
MSGASMADSSRSTGYRGDVEGLRAVAILGVVLFHAGVPGITGGFAGVDVFFVISGFLITGMLVREATASGRVRLARFYGARVRRLLPAGCTVLVVTAVASAVRLPPIRAREAMWDGVASALYVGNYRFASSGTDYLNADAPPSPFQHYWSLGVEEQFYLGWPALIVATVWLTRRRTRGKHAAAEVAWTGYLLSLTVVALASFAVCALWTRTLPPWALFSRRGSLEESRRAQGRGRGRGASGSTSIRHHKRTE